MRPGPEAASSRARAWRFVVGMGVVSLLADVTYEGGRSVIGPYLAVLGATPFVVGAVAGAGEFLGYGLRLLSGRWVDRGARPWRLVFAGYTVNLLAVPALALATTLAPAVGLVLAERLGKGVRTPARDVLLARASEAVGRGSAFGLHELLDQVGAVAGPLLVAGAVAWGGYRLGFGVLLLPAAATLAVLAVARRLEPGGGAPADATTGGPLPAVYHRYLAFVAVSVAGFAPFALASYRLEVDGVVPAAGIPLLFALAMAVDAAAAYLAGRAYDRVGLRVLVVLPALVLPTAPLLFLGGGLLPVVLGIGAWGAALGVQESVLRAGVADLAPSARHGAAYGRFYAAFGLAWMLGSSALGALYDVAPVALVAGSVALELCALVPLGRLLAGGTS